MGRKQKKNIKTFGGYKEKHYLCTRISKEETLWQSATPTMGSFKRVTVERKFG